MSDRGITVDVLAPGSPLLTDVVALGDRHARYLGHFPRSCFEREAAKGMILVALSNSKMLMGYLLYRVARNRAVIQHLCVEDIHRGCGVGRTLTDNLKERTKHLDGIMLHCARDFPAHDIWRSYGFVPIGEKPGRGQVSRDLTRYWFDHGHPTLFADGIVPESHRLPVVIDANVAFSLQDDDDPECCALGADYLQEEIELFITAELYHEINRHGDSANRCRRRGFAQGIRQIDAAQELIEQHLAHLQDIVPHPQSSSGRSDLIHLATATAGKARFFVTKDIRLLGYADVVEENFGLRIVQPAALIAQIDESYRVDTYQPSLLKGSDVHIRRVGSSDFQSLSQHFLATGRGERRNGFIRHLGANWSGSHEVEPLVFEHPKGKPVALCVITVREPALATVSMCRIRPGPLATTLAHFLATHIIRTAVHHRCSEAVVSEPYSMFPLDHALTALGFTREGADWRRRIDYGCRLDLLPPHDEQLRWPAKFLGEDIQSFVIPIKPHYFRDLIGTEPGPDDMGLLFGGDPRLILSPESVYYRSARPGVVEAPGRILWYESKGAGDGRQALVACSIVRGVEVGPVKQVFDRYRRYGVLEWRHVLKVAGGCPEDEIMAVRYGLTEHFLHPVPFKNAQATLRRHLGTAPQFVTATRIPEACFEEFYNTGMGLAKSGEP